MSHWARLLSVLHRDYQSAVMELHQESKNNEKNEVDRKCPAASSGILEWQRAIAAKQGDSISMGVVEAGPSTGKAVPARTRELFRPWELENLIVDDQDSDEEDRPLVIDLTEEAEEDIQVPRQRTILSRSQRAVLEAVFCSTSKPDRIHCEILSRELDLVYQVVKVWFQNRRAKEKRLAARLSNNSKN